MADEEPGRFKVNGDDPRTRDQSLSAAQLLVLQEVEFGLGRFFGGGRATRQVSVHTERGLPMRVKREDGAQFEVVVWEHTGVHERSLAGIAPTGLTAVVRGVSLVALPEAFPEAALELASVNLEQVKIARSVDWLDVFAQLGVVLASRPLGGDVDEQPDLRDR